MKIHRYFTSGILAAGALLLAGLDRVEATPNLVVAAFATGTQGQPNGGQYGGDDISVPYGAGTITWDGVTFDAADGSTGAAYITANFSSANNTDVLVSMGPGYNNWYNVSSGENVPGWPSSDVVDFTQYNAVQFDILYDTNSALTIAQFNTGDDWPTNYLTPAALATGGSNYMATSGGYYTQGINVDMFTGSGGNNVGLATFQIPESAATGWTTVTVPYSDTIAGISTGAGIWFQGAFGGGSGINGGPYNASFWIDNLTLVGNLTVTPPPTLSISPVVQGLNLFTSSGTGLNNRESLETTGNNYSWVGASGPVSYSFTIASYPIPKADQVQCHIFLDPNPSAGSAPDFADPNLIFLDLESTATGGAQWMFRYKTNEPGGNTMVYGSGTLASITSPTGVGTWTVTFVNNTNVTMTIPGGASTNFNIPDSTGATSALFASGVVLFYGTQANNTGGENDHFVAADFNVTGLGSSDFNDNFVADAGTLNTAIWEVNASTPICVQLIGPGDPYWVQWTTPASGYSLDSTASLSGSPVWTPTTSNLPFPTGTFETQLISTNDLPAGNAAFFSLIKRTFSQLLVLLPGETNAPNTTTGKIGTPTSYSVSADGGVATVTATVVAVDADFYPVGGITDTIQITDNGGGIDPNNAALVNGTAQYNVYYENSANNIVITATDETTTTIPPAMSSQFNVAP